MIVIGYVSITTVVMCHGLTCEMHVQVDFMTEGYYHGRCYRLLLLPNLPILS